MKEIYGKFPSWIKSTLLLSEGWMVGGAIRKLKKGETPRDWDIIVPSRELYQLVVSQISTHKDIKIQINSCGGIKFTQEEGEELDIWCEELDHFITRATHWDYAFNFKRQLLIKKDS